MPSEDSPWLSVITVVKDAPDDFTATVESLAAQDLSGVDYVVVDSSSDADPVRQALTRLTGAACQYTWTEPRGIYAAMNAGLAWATGEYVYFLNAGDTLHHADVLARVREACSTHRPAWAFGPVEIIGAGGTRTITPPWDYAREKAALFGRGKFPPHQGTFARRTTLVDLGGFEPSYSIVADYAAFLKLSTVADPLALDLVIATFVEGGVSTTRWPESLKQFHRARRAILAPRGVAAAREYAETVRHATAMALYRGVVSKLVRR